MRWPSRWRFWNPAGHSVPRLDLAGAHQIDALWGKVSHGLEAACRRSGGDLTADYLWAECRSGRAFLVVVSSDTWITGASVYRFEQWTSGKVLRCLALYGTGMADWLPQLLSLLREMARAGGALRLVTEGRTGFARALPKVRVLRQVYEMDIEP